jgi:hypothetical protein
VLSRLDEKTVAVICLHPLQVDVNEKRGQSALFLFLEMDKPW